VPLRDLLLDRGHAFLDRLSHRGEVARATRYWAGLRSYHETNEGDPKARERSEFIADVLVPELGLTSLLEVGTNTGRNLAAVKATHPDMRVRGLDVNRRALDHGRQLHPDVEFMLADANRWPEPPDAWDAVLTMSVLDHVPVDAVPQLTRNMAQSARHVITFELYDGSEGKRALYKYSYDLRARFEALGLRTLRWEQAPGQYDTAQSLLWLYVGVRA
jgi:hypothetical protein